LARKQNKRLKDFALLEATTYIRMSFVTVKFSKDQSLLFNPNCKILVLLDDIKKRCKCPDNAIIEVSDTKGEIKHLQEHLDDYATSLLKGRETLILLEIKTNEETKELRYVPLLKNVKKLYPGAYERLSKAKTSHPDNKDCSEDGSKNFLKVQRHRQSMAVGLSTGNSQVNNNNNNNNITTINHNNNTLQVTRGNKKQHEEHKRKIRSLSHRS